NFGECRHQVGVTFELEDAADLADDQCVGGNLQLFAQGQIVCRVEKRFEVKAAENAREHLRLADAGGEIKFRHRPGRAEEMIGDLGGAAFGGGEDKIGQRALKRAE